MLDMSQPVLPLTGGYGSFGGAGMGAGTGVAGGVLGFLLGAMINGNGGGLLGGNRASGVGVADFALDANTAGRITGLEAGIANLTRGADTNLILDKVDGTQDLVSNLSTAQATANFTTLQSINGLGNNIIASQTQALIQSLQTANLQTATMQQGFNEIGRDASTATNQLIMGQNVLASQMAQCCCDIKSELSEKIAGVSALINDIESQRKNVEISDLKAQVSNLSQTNALNANNAMQTSTILQHLVPLFTASRAVTV